MFSVALSVNIPLRDAARTLSGTLLCGVRTFLPCSRAAWTNPAFAGQERPSGPAVNLLYYSPGMIRTIVEIVAAACAAFGVVFYVVSMLSAWRFARQARPEAKAYPPVSILKPVRGADPHAYECFRSHCLLDYPDYEIIFGVHDVADPAVPLIERLKREFPERRIELVIGPQELGTNRKVSNLIQMLPAARL